MFGSWRQSVAATQQDRATIAVCQPSNGLDDPDLAFAVGRRTTFEIGKLGVDRKAGKLEQIGHLLAGRPAEMVRGVLTRDETARPVDPLQSKRLDEGLVQRIVGAGDAASSEGVTVFRIERFPIGVRCCCTGHAGVQDGIEDVEDQPAARLEMPMDRHEAGALLLRPREMLKGAERHEGERKSLIEVERRDVGLDQLEPLADGVSIGIGLTSCRIEHTLGPVQADDLVPSLGERPGDPAGADAKFQDGAAKALGRGEIEGDIAGDLPVRLFAGSPVRSGGRRWRPPGPSQKNLPPMS